MALAAAGTVGASCGGQITPVESTVKINNLNVALAGSILDDDFGLITDIDPAVPATQSTVLVGGFAILAIGDPVPTHTIKQASESPILHVGAILTTTSNISVNVGP
jgi:hypothetical protein